MLKLEVFDPPMCCSSGVCGPSVDPALPRFAADLEWLKGQGLTVMRYNLAQQPMVFAENAVVCAALTANENCLPLTLVDGRIVAQGQYLLRAELAVAVCNAVGLSQEDSNRLSPELAALAQRHERRLVLPLAAAASGGCCGGKGGEACCG